MLINLIRNNYGNFTRPCLKCAAAIESDGCTLFEKQCNLCPLYEYWSKNKKDAQNLKIPFINGLSPNSHPAQIISDIFTIEEIKRKPISKLNICWIGDSNNVLTSLIEASIKLNFKLNFYIKCHFRIKIIKCLKIQQQICLHLYL